MRIVLEHVSHTYAPSAESAGVTVLDDVSCTIASGDFAVLMGASGSGKSTLLNLIGAVDRPSSGSIHLDQAETVGQFVFDCTDRRQRGVQLLTLAHHFLRGGRTVPDRGVFGLGVQLVEAAQRIVPVKDASSAGRWPAGSHRRYGRFRDA